MRHSGTGNEGASNIMTANNLHRNFRQSSTFSVAGEPTFLPVRAVAFVVDLESLPGAPRAPVLSRGRAREFISSR
jgi:hypothetical protein